VVNRLGFGAMRLTGDLFGAGAPSDRGQSVAVLRRAVELGVNHVDTAAFYFSPLRSANELINTALAPYPDDLLIATKVGPWRDTWGEWQGMARPDQLRGQVEENLRQLGRDHLDLVTLRTLSVAAPVGDHVAALAALRDAGLVRFLGLSNVTVGQIDEALAVAPVATVQNRYSIDSRRPEADDVLRACAERGIAFVPYFAIAGDGREGGRRAGELEPVLAVARAHGATAAQVRLAWTLAQGDHVLAIPGTSSLAHLAENVAAGALRLTGADLALLGSLA
jgi:aryl-alcohol dehydrogenase-like predicted oxidoreductase